MIVKKCLSCDSEFVITSKSNRYCLKCQNERNFCQVCGKPVKPKKDRDYRLCLECYRKSVEKPIFCVDCGIQLKGFTSKRCQPCHQKHRLEVPRKARDETKNKIKEHAIERYADKNYKRRWKKKIAKRTQSIEWRDAMRKNNPGWQRGENHVGWKGGEGQTGRDGYKYKEWRKAVMVRDSYTCQVCGKKSRRLHAHHKKEWAKHPELRYDVDNGMAVCIKCHRKIHGFYIPENFIEFHR